MSGTGRTGGLARASLLSAGVLLVAALVGIVNYLGMRYYHRFDWTSSQIYSLSEKTLSILAGLDRDIEVTLFLREDSPLYDSSKELLGALRGEVAARPFPNRLGGQEPHRGPAPGRQVPALRPERRGLRERHRPPRRRGERPRRLRLLGSPVRRQSRAHRLQGRGGLQRRDPRARREPEAQGPLDLRPR